MTGNSGRGGDCPVNVWEFLVHIVEIFLYDWCIKLGDVQLDDDQIGSVAIQSIGDSSHLMSERAVHEAFGRQRFRSVSANVARRLPLDTGNDMK